MDGGRAKGGAGHRPGREAPRDGAGAPDRASTLELFFDLVFVFTITQVATVVVRSPDGAGLLRASLELGVVAWMYGGYAWMTNAANLDAWPRRLLLLAGMAGFFVCSLAVPRAFDEDGVVFGCGYLLINLVHLAGFLLTPGRTSVDAIVRLAPWNLASAGLVLGAGWAHGAADWALWGGALAVQLATPLLARAHVGFAFNAAHFAERHGGVILIVLGESLVSVGVVPEHHHLDASLLLGALAGLVAASAMWWTYFAGDDARATAAFEATPGERQGVQAILGYGLTHAVMIFGVIAVAAGTKLSVHDLTAPTTPFAAWLIAAGAALFLAGAALFRLVFGFAPPRLRAIGVLLCPAVVPIGTRVSTSAELASVGAVFAVVLVAEHRWTASRSAPHDTASEHAGQ